MIALKILGLLVSIGWSASEKEIYDGLSVTWSPDVSNPYAFNPLPRTEKDAVNQNWKKSGDGCKDSSRTYVGTRYTKDGNFSAMTIYDARGNVAGLQTAMEKPLLDKNGLKDYAASPAAQKETIEGVERYVFTAYFMDPKKVCDGRSDKDFQEQGTIGDLLYLQTGNGSFITISPSENRQRLEGIGFTYAKCVPMMGHHYYWGFDDCNLFPFFLLYDSLHDSEMAGFGFQTIGHYDSYRYEYPPEDILTSLFETVPGCLHKIFAEANGVTSMHVYRVRNPRQIQC